MLLVVPSKVASVVLQTTVASVVPQLPALGGANFPQDAILTNLLFLSNQNLTFLTAICIN